MPDILAIAPGIPDHVRLIPFAGLELRVEVVEDAAEPLAKAAESTPDLLVLAGMAIDEQAELATRFQLNRRWRLVPVLYLVPRESRGFTVPGSFRPEIDGLSRGALDSEPVLRKIVELAREGIGQSELITAGPFELDAFRGRLKIANVEVDLTEREAEILAILLARPGRTVSAAEIIERGWGAAPDDRYLQILRRHVSNIRRKLEGTPGYDAVRTVRGSGYLFEVRQAEIRQAS